MKKLFIGACLIGFVGFLILMPSCNKQSTAVNNITFDSVSVTKVYHLDHDSTKPSCSLKLEYVYPTTFDDKDVLRKIQEELNIALMEDESYGMFPPADAVAKYAEDYVANYKEEVDSQRDNWNELDDPHEYFSFYKTITTKVLFNKGNILSYQIKAMDYKGERSSATYYYNIVLELKTGECVVEQDIFLPEYKKPLNSLLIKKIVEKNKASTPEELIELGYWGIDDLDSNNNFTVDEKGLTFIFNQGEYSTLTVGDIKVFLSYNEIEYLLKADSPISVFSGK